MATKKSIKIIVKGNKVKFIGDIEKRYLIGLTIGKGAYGTVKKAKNEKTGLTEAIKLVPIKSISKKEVQNELEVMKHLGMYPSCNQYIICYNDIYRGIYNDIEYYIFSMEFFEGKELLDLIEMKNASFNEIPYPHIRTIVKDLLAGISFMHEKTISHRDIKSNNAMFNSSGLRIVDFGFACYGDSCKSLRGTEMYLPPEKYLLIKKGGWESSYTNLRKNEEKADVWAVGIILLELLTDYDIDETVDYVIKGGGSEKNIIKVLTEKKWSKTPSDLKQILLRSLEYDMEERATADDLLTILRKSKNKYSNYEKIWNFWLKCKDEEKELF